MAIDLWLENDKVNPWLGDYFKICDAQVPHMNGLVELDLCICGFSRPLDMEGQLCVCVCVCVCVSLLKSK